MRVLMLLITGILVVTFGCKPRRDSSSVKDVGIIRDQKGNFYVIQLLQSAASYRQNGQQILYFSQCNPEPELKSFRDCIPTKQVHLTSSETEKVLTLAYEFNRGTDYMDAEFLPMLRAGIVVERQASGGVEVTLVNSSIISNTELLNGTLRATLDALDRELQALKEQQQ